MILNEKCIVLSHLWSYVTKILVTYNINEHVSLSFVFVSLKTVTYLQFLLKNQKKISLIVEHTMEWRRKKRWETIYSLKETSSAQLRRNQPVLYHLSVFQKSLQDTTKYRGISSFIRQNFGIHGISWGATLPHSEAWNTMSSKLLALRLNQ